MKRREAETQKRFSLQCKNPTDFYLWDLQLGYKDSNLEMLESESSALPFGDSPIRENRMYYILLQEKLQALF